MPGRAGAERVRGEVQPPLDEARGQLRLAVVAVVESTPTSAAPITTNAASRGEALVERDAVELVAQVRRRAPAGREVGPAVDAGLDAVDGVHDDEVRDVDAAQRRPPGRARASPRARRCGSGPSAAASCARGRPRSTGAVPASGPRPARRRPRRRPSASRSPARCAAVTSGNSTGPASTYPGRRGPGRRRARARLAERDHRDRPLVRRRRRRRASRHARVGEAACRATPSAPRESAAASSCESIVPASQ